MGSGVLNQSARSSPIMLAGQDSSKSPRGTFTTALCKAYTYPMPIPSVISKNWLTNGFTLPITTPPNLYTEKCTT
ncbi:hypothetical protein DNTS_008385 [Danionella cerebrum]|uniref:Uncharacterized protein n=1 Tax=Danionella cerebrum TaxID=2873325 RepID=A0A553N0V3_9TELE|nr:hypothetical protein DNTS_008385 [Danionella translucida]